MLTKYLLQLRNEIQGIRSVINHDFGKIFFELSITDFDGGALTGKPRGGRNSIGHVEQMRPTFIPKREHYCLRYVLFWV